MSRQAKRDRQDAPARRHCRQTSNAALRRQFVVSHHRRPLVDAQRSGRFDKARRRRRTADRKFLNRLYTLPTTAPTAPADSWRGNDRLGYEANGDAAPRTGARLCTSVYGVDAIARGQKCLRGPAKIFQPKADFIAYPACLPSSLPACCRAACRAASCLQACRMLVVW
jgi:hypothetical protein